MQDAALVPEERVLSHERRFAPHEVSEGADGEGRGGGRPAA